MLFGRVLADEAGDVSGGTESSVAVSESLLSVGGECNLNQLFSSEAVPFLSSELLDADLSGLQTGHIVGIAMLVDEIPEDLKHMTVRRFSGVQGDADEILRVDIFRSSLSDDDTQWPIIRGGSSVQRASFETSVTFISAKQPAQTANDSDPPEVIPQPAGVGAGAPKQTGNVTVIPTLPGAAAVSPGPTSQSPAVQVTPAEVPVVKPPDAGLTLEVVTSRRVAAEQLTDLPDEVKTQLSRYFQRAVDLLTQKAEAEKKAAELKAEKDNGPTLIAEYKALLAQPPPKAEPEYPPGATVSELDQLRLTDEEKLAESRRNLELWEARAKIRTERKPQMPSLIEATRKQLEEAEKALEGAGPEGELPIVGIARRTEQEAAVLLLRAQLELYRTEQIRYETLNALFPLQQDVLTRARNSAEKRVELWKVIVADARREESARQAREAREKLRNAHPTLKNLAEENSSLTVRRREMQDFLAQKTADLSSVNATLASVEHKFKSVTEKENLAGRTTAMGLLLRSQRAQLPSPEDYRRRQLDAEVDIVRLQTEQMPLQDERNELGDIEAKVESTLREIASANAGDNELRQMSFELLTDRRQYLDDLLADYSSCLQALGETDVSCRRLETIIRDYQTFIDERVLWIRSAPAVEFGFLRRTLATAQSFVAHREWRSLWTFLMSDVQSYWPLYGVILTGVGLIFGLTRRARRFITHLGETAEKQLDAGIPLALLASGLTIILASGWPTLLWFLGWRLSGAGLHLSSALSSALTVCAVAVWIVDTFRTLCRKNGVTVSFLEWPRTIVRSLQANLLLYLSVGVPLSFVVVAAGKLDDGTSADSVGRLAFVVFCVLLAVILRRLVRPTGQVIGDLLRSNPNSLMYRLRWLWYPLAVGSPLCLALLALMGYQYTAEQLMIRLQLTLGLSFLLVIIYTMIMQWMLAARRSLALRQARARRAAALAAAQRETEASGGVTSPIPPVEIPQVDLSLLNQQMLRLVQGSACILFLSMSWAIWWQVLPALQVFSRIPLWSVVVESTEQISTATEGTGIRDITRIEPVTLGHLLFALIVFSAAILASRNLPGLLELAVLQRLPMDHGGRHAITTLCRYAFLLAGVVVACNFIGIHWNSVQWLVAALTVGLGFGLQEIFANFVSGLIILFERPVRIGDLVTIDNVSGCVSKIQIRATTITDWDRKEYIVPNKEFVTGKVLNWTLSDRTNRIVINVGVAYGTDTGKALELLAQVTDEHPLVLKDPAPVIGFEGFGDSSLNLVLRCFLPNFDHRLKVISQLHVAIERRFRDAGIEIAFPQRDLHIRSLPPQFATGAASAMQQPPTAPRPETDDEDQAMKRSA